MRDSEKSRQWALRKISTTRLYSEAAGTHGYAREQLYDRVVIDHIDLAESVARRYCGSSPQHDFDDIRQVACLGLVKAARRFDPIRGDDFVSFAVPTIAGEIKRYLRDCGWVIKPPRRVQELRSRVNQAEPQLAQSLGRTPGIADLSRDLEEPPGDIEAALAAYNSLRPASLDGALLGDAELTVGDTIAATNDGFAQAEILVSLAPAMRTLPERERKIVYLRFFEEKTQQEIASIIGVTQMHVSRLLSRSLIALRTSLESGPGSPVAAAPLHSAPRRREPSVVA
jgi:RNA polymerase sigma-B factor